MSELMREAFRVYLEVRKRPAYTLTPQELRALKKGRTAMRRGELYPSVDAFIADVERTAQKASPKTRRSRTKTRTRKTLRRAP